MAQRVMTMKAWLRQCRAYHADPGRVQGPSPGGAAAELGISRQAVHKLVTAGKLDMIVVVDDNDNSRLRMKIIPGSSLDRWKRNPRHIGQKRSAMVDA